MTNPAIVIMKLDVSRMSHYADFSPEFRFSAVEVGPNGSGTLHS